ncbi:DNA polymerase Y family protein [Azospirillum sp. SYSU D00513]|uniref:Y-family DNA polymerase n=1 Tax=Azospirillum sp. SYSU D00513 TaxID=2812561 RepID=UPI001FFEC8E2|nr:DNA polymerase Y family protein [Azospirillum sp. SYSU D00513]
MLLDVTGCAHLFGGEEALRADLIARLRRAGFAVRAAVADTPAAAWAAARFAPRAGIVPPGGQAEALAPLPVAALRLPEETVRGLEAVGLRRIRDLAPVPRATLARRFGAELARRLDQAFGALDEPLSPRLPVPPHEERLALAEPISTPDSIALAALHLIGGLCRRLAAEHRGLRRLELTVFRTDHGPDSVPQSVAIGTGRPVRDPAALMRLLGGKLERIAPGPGLELLVLAAPLVEPLAPAQAGLTGAEEKGKDLGALLDRLANRLGEDSLLRLVPRQSWLPERSVAGVPPLDAGLGADSESAPLWPDDRPRPVRLLVPPEPIEVVAPVPDDPPKLFRWRGATHRVGKADGPERLCAEWWRHGGELRDYYRVEDMEGRRFWVFRLGLHRPEAPAGWFLHGFFA